MELFANQQESNLLSCVTMIEEVIVALGHELSEARVPSHDETRAWWIRKGSAYVQVKLLPKDGLNYLKVAAPVIVLDDQVDAVELFRRLLELNAETVIGAGFALQGNQVLLLAERSTVDLDRSEVEDLVRRVSAYADQYDDQLLAEYGGALPRRP